MTNKMPYLDHGEEHDLPVGKCDQWFHKARRHIFMCLSGRDHSCLALRLCSGPAATKSLRWDGKRKSQEIKTVANNPAVEKINYVGGIIVRILLAINLRILKFMFLCC